MPTASFYHDFFNFLDRLAGSRADPWSLYEEYYLTPHRAVLTAWWEQCLGRPVEVWQGRVRDVQVEHYAGIRAMLAEAKVEADAQEALRRCYALLPAPEPTVNLLIGFFSPDGFVLQVEDEWQIGLGLERLGDARRVPLLVAHEYAHWYRRSLGLPQAQNLGERLIEEGLATYLSAQAYPERSLAEQLFISESRLATLRAYRAALLDSARRNFDESEPAAIQKFLYLHAPGRELPLRPGGYVAYEMIAEYLRGHSGEMRALFAEPANRLLSEIGTKAISG